MSMQLTKEQQFEAMTTPFLAGLYQTALYFASDRHRADEILGDAYVSAWKSFNGDMEEACWRLKLFQILMGCVRQQRSGWAANQRVDTVLARLPVAEREVVVLIDGQGFTYKEAAQVLNLSVETLSRTLTRGRDFLLQKVSLEALPPQSSVQSE